MQTTMSTCSEPASPSKQQSTVTKLTRMHAEVASQSPSQSPSSPALLPLPLPSRRQQQHGIKPHNHNHMPTRRRRTHKQEALSPPAHKPTPNHSHHQLTPLSLSLHTPTHPSPESAVQWRNRSETRLETSREERVAHVPCFRCFDRNGPDFEINYKSVVFKFNTASKICPFGNCDTQSKRRQHQASNVVVVKPRCVCL